MGSEVELHHPPYRLLHWVKVSGQLHTQEAEWAPDPVWTLRREQFHHARNRSQTFQAIQTETTRLLSKKVTFSLLSNKRNAPYFALRSQSKLCKLSQTQLMWIIFAKI
jgi:hypothetical protein